MIQFFSVERNIHQLNFAIQTKFYEFSEPRTFEKTNLKNSTMLLHIVQGTQKFDLETNCVDCNGHNNDQTGSQQQQEWTVGKLRQEIQQKTGISTETMRLIHRGKTLTNEQNDCSLTQMGFKNKDKVMVLGKKPDQPLDETERKLRDFETGTISTIDQNAKSLRDELDSVKKGFLPPKEHSETVRTATKRRLVVNEDCMKALEFLDAFQLGDGESKERSRAKRKALVQHLQSVLGELDEIDSELTGLSQK